MGKEVASKLVEQGLTVIVTGRREDKVNEVVDQLKTMGKGYVDGHQLDVTDESSVFAFKNWLRSRYGGCDVIVHNASYKSRAREGQTGIQRELSVNVRGVMSFTDTIVDLVPSRSSRSRQARIAFISSTAGKRHIVQGRAREQLQKATSSADLAALADSYESAWSDGTLSQQGFPSNSYGFSKLLETTYARVLARRLRNSPDGKYIVNSCCPGSVSEGGGKGTKTFQEGADTPVFLALCPSDFRSGSFWKDRRLLGF